MSGKPVATKATDLVEVLKPQDRSQRLTIGTIVDRASEVSASALMLVPAALLVTPLAGLPGFSAIMGICIAIIAGQVALGRKTLWLPNWLRGMSVRASRFDDALCALERPAQAADQYTRRRLPTLTSPIARRASAGFAFCAGALMPVLEFVPFSSSLLGAVIAVQMLGLLTRDGYVVLASGLPFAAAAVGIWVI